MGAESHLYWFTWVFLEIYFVKLSISTILILILYIYIYCQSPLPAGLDFMIGKICIYLSYYVDLLVFNYITIFYFTLGHKEGSIMYSLTLKKTFFPPLWLSMGLELWQSPHPYFLYVWKMGMIKEHRKVFPFFPPLFSQYMLITSYLLYWKLLYIFLNKQEISEIPHLSLQPWPRPGALDNECN